MEKTPKLSRLKVYGKVLSISILLAILPIALFIVGCGSGTNANDAVSPSTPIARAATNWQIKSIDAQVVSKHWGTVPESTIQTIAEKAKSLGATHLAIAVPYENQTEWQKWTRVVHGVGLKVWSRSHPNSWEGDNGIAANLTPTDYNTKTSQFLSDNASFLQSGDLFTYCVEPENGKYWTVKYGGNWSSNTTAVTEYNKFIRDGITQGDAILSGKGFAQGTINTRLVSVNGWIANNILEQSTVDLMGVITVDHYVEFDDSGNRITNNIQAMKDKMSRDLDQLRQRWGKRLFIGEWGFPIDQELSDEEQRIVTEGIFSIFASKDLLGVNYWNFMGNTARLLNDSGGIPTTLRSAATVIQNYFTGTAPTPDPTPVPTTGTLIISDYENGLGGWDSGTIVPGFNSAGSLEVSNPANGSNGAKKDISKVSLNGYSNLELDINLRGTKILPGDASALYFDQGGWKYVSLTNYVQNGLNGWQHILVPIAAFTSTATSSGTPLNTGSTAAYLGVRFWNTPTGIYDIDNVKLTSGTTPPPPPPSGGTTPSPTPIATYTLSNFETGLNGFIGGRIVTGNNSKYSLEITNPANGSSGSKKSLNGAKLGSYNYVELDINLKGIKLLTGDASALYFDQGGWKYVSLTNYVQNGLNGWQHITIPVKAFTSNATSSGIPLNPASGMTSIGFRFWNTPAASYDIDNIVYTQR